MDPLVERVDRMKSSDACALLSEIARSVESAGTPQTEWDLEQKLALKEAFGIRAALLKTNEEDIAREALKVALLDDNLRRRIEVIIDDVEPRKYDLVSTSVIVAAFIVLQTRIKFKWDSEGKRSLTIEKKAADKALLKPLVERLLSYIPKGPFGS